MMSWVELLWLEPTLVNSNLPGENVELLGEDELGGTILWLEPTLVNSYLPGENVELLGEDELGGTTLVGLWKPM